MDLEQNCFFLRRTRCTWWSWWNMTNERHKSGRNQNLPHLWQSGQDIWAHQVTSWWWASEIAGTKKRKWLRTHDESEWSLKTSLMLRFWSPYPELTGRSLRRMWILNRIVPFLCRSLKTRQAAFANAKEALWIFTRIGRTGSSLAQSAFTERNLRTWKWRVLTLVLCDGGWQLCHNRRTKVSTWCAIPLHRFWSITTLCGTHRKEASPFCTQLFWCVGFLHGVPKYWLDYANNQRNLQLAARGLRQQSKQVHQLRWPFLGERTFVEHISDLLVGVHIFDLDGLVNMDLIKHVAPMPRLWPSAVGGGHGRRHGREGNSVVVLARRSGAVLARFSCEAGEVLVRF